MLTIDDCERVLAQTIRADSGLEIPVEDLLVHLLSDLSGYQSRATDGVVFEHSRVIGSRAVASGVVFMIDDQTIEPLRVEFTLDASSARVSAGSVYFGDRVAHGSWDSRKLRNAIIADPEVEFSWRECFRRDQNGWHRGAA
jgi:hypothetical protein